MVETVEAFGGDRWESLMEAGLHALEDLDTRSACECFEAAATEAEAMGPDEPRLVSSLRNLIGALGAHQRYEEAEPHLERVLDLSIRTLGPDHPDVVTCLEHLAWLAERRGADDRARDLYRSAFDTEDRALDHGDVRAMPTLVSLARLYHDGGIEDGDALSDEIADRLEALAETCQTQGRLGRADKARAAARHLKRSSH